MAEFKWKSPQEVMTTDVGEKLKAIDLSVPSLNKIYADIDACTTVGELQAIRDKFYDDRAVIEKADSVMDTIRDRIYSRLELL